MGEVAVRGALPKHFLTLPGHRVLFPGLFTFGQIHFLGQVHICSFGQVHFWAGTRILAYSHTLLGGGTRPPR